MPAPLRSFPAAAFVCLLGAVAATAAPAEDYENVGHAVGVGFGELSARHYDKARRPLEAARDMLLADKDARLRDLQLRSVQQGLMVVYAHVGEPKKAIEAGDWLARHTAPEHDATVRATTGALVGLLGRDEKARGLLRKTYETALKKDARDRVALLVLAEVAERDDDLEAAAEYLERLIKLDGKTTGGAAPRDRMEHARMLELSGDRKAAARAYEALAEAAEVADNKRAFAPSSAGRLALSAAQNWLAVGDTANARRAAERASRVGDAGLDGAMSYYFHDWLGDLWVKLGEPAKAIPHFERAIEVTTIDGYRTGSRGALADAQAAVAKSQADEPNADEPNADGADEPPAALSRAEKAAARKARRERAKAAREAKRAAGDQ